MNQDFQRFVDRWVGIPLCAVLSLVLAIRRWFGRAEPAPPRNILVVLLSEMGSLVLAYPMLLALQKRYPEAKLHALMFAKNREVIELLGVKPTISVMTIRDAGLLTFALDVLRSLRAMRRHRIDVVIDCELFSRVSSVLCALSGAPRRVGFHPHTQEGLYRGSHMTHPVLYNPHRHIADQFLTLAAAIDSKATPRGKDAARHGFADAAATYPLPALAVSQAELDVARTKLVKEFPAADKQRLILVYPSGGALPIRAWPEEHFAQLCNGLISDGFAVAIIGLSSDQVQAARLVNVVGSRNCASLAGFTANVRELITLFHLAELLISNDGGPGHFAAMAQLPTLMFFGPETPRLYGSLSPKVIPIHREAMPCSPCLTAANHRKSPCDGDNQCLKQIQPDDVLQQARLMVRA